MTPLEMARSTRGRVDQSTIYRWQQLRGCVERIDCKTMQALCEELNLEVADVIELDEHRPRKRA